MQGTKYVSKQPDANGICHYTDDENSVWQFLYNRQMEVIKERACKEFIDGLALLNMSAERIPQCADVSKALMAATGWQVEPVPALIPSERFFSLLANCKFPAATFIRNRDELDYLQEPDIFHEFYGHCPLLAQQNYANFVQKYGELSLRATPQERSKLLRLFWLTIEFGLIREAGSLRIYGGGILSSKEETIYALDANVPQRKPFNILDALRTPYRIDIKQPIYYIIDSMDTLFDILQADIMQLVREAIKLGDFPPQFNSKQQQEVSNDRDQFC